MQSQRDGGSDELRQMCSSKVRRVQQRSTAGQPAHIHGAVSGRQSESEQRRRRESARRRARARHMRNMDMGMERPNIVMIFVRLKAVTERYFRDPVTKIIISF